jgi:undecaprenyl-diphosphatase
MTAWEAILLGVVQGLSEFFPVSSSGHLVLFEHLFGMEPDGGLVFEVALHLATGFAIALYYRARIASLVAGVLRRESEALHYTLMLGVATLPAVVVGLSAKDFIERQFSNPVLVGAALIVTGFIVWSTRRTAPLATTSQPTLRIALLVGCGQAFAILPGISRSGTTVAVALALGFAPAAAAEFSFLMGIIAIAGAAVLMLPDLQSVSPAATYGMLLGGLAALITGLAAITLFVRMLKAQSFHLFALYCWPVGTAFLIWSLAQ